MKRCKLKIELLLNMIQEYTKDMFEKDKEDMLEWLEDNWKWGVLIKPI